MNQFEQALRSCGREGLQAADIYTLQVNLGFRCNLQCRHCHVEASPERREVMTWETMEQILQVTEQLPGCRFDLTGGAPELNPHFRRFIAALRRRDVQVQVRTNLTVLLEEGMADLPSFYRQQGVQLVASLPCYLEENVRAQRGAGVYERAVRALQLLNQLGYGNDPALPLSLVYNPGGPFLPPDQTTLESAYKRELHQRFGLHFNQLYTIANMPIGRFLSDLKTEDKAEDYCRLLRSAFNPQTLDGLMCRHQVCVGWDGQLYDCDFNLALGVTTGHGAPLHIRDFERGALAARRVVTGDHCFACTAGCGSSCGGSLVHDDDQPYAAVGGT